MRKFSEVRIKSIVHITIEPGGLLPMPLGQQVTVSVGWDSGGLSLGLGPKNGNGDNGQEKNDSDDS
jgi:hypothetical protein